MGSNMQRQAVPLLVRKLQLLEPVWKLKWRDSRSVILAEESGYVEYADSKRIIVKYDVDESAPETLVCFDDERRVEHSTKFSGINQETCFNQKPVVVTGQKLRR